MDNSKKIILDLCGGTGAWSAPYKAAGYDVRLITLPEHDILEYEPPKNVYGILAAPPCTDFSIMGVNLWKEKDADGRTEQSLKVVKQCLKIVEEVNPAFWALENPRGRLKHFIGNYSMSYNYKDFGCRYSKTVCLWGKFKIFIPDYIGITRRNMKNLLQEELTNLPVDYDYKGAKMARRAAQRSITYAGFAKAFFKANQ